MKEREKREREEEMEVEWCDGIEGEGKEGTVWKNGEIKEKR